MGSLELAQGLRERYEVPEELPAKLLALVRKLNDSDWLLPGVSSENDVDLFGGLKVTVGSSPS
jgi:hypothetical protein